MNEPTHPMFDPANLGDQEVARLANLQRLVQAGVQPYPARVRRTHTMAEARTLYDDGQAGDQQVTVTGRIKRMRIMGKMSFADLEDGSGSLQVVLRKDNLEEGVYDGLWRQGVDLGCLLYTSPSPRD